MNHEQHDSAYIPDLIVDGLRSHGIYCAMVDWRPADGLYLGLDYSTWELRVRDTPSGLLAWVITAGVMGPRTVHEAHCEGADVIAFGCEHGWQQVVDQVRDCWHERKQHLFTTSRTDET